jgi:hypothetical protein
MNRSVIFIWTATLAFMLVVVAAQALTWNATSSLPEGRRDVCLVYYSGYVYCLGGRPADEGTTGIGAVDTVYYAAVNPDGSIGTWAAASSLPAARSNGGAAAYDGRLYYWGGWGTDFTTHNDCYYVTINPDGSLGTWVTSSITIPDSGTANAQMDSFGSGRMRFGKYLYIVNGEDNSETNQTAVYYSEIQPGGDYGTWTSTTATPTGFWFHGVVAYEGASSNYIYRVAGNESFTTENGVIYATINSDGTIGTWNTATAIIPGPSPSGRYDFGCAIADGKIYIIGGVRGFRAQDEVFYGAIDPATGDIPSIVQDTDFYPAERARIGATDYVAGSGWYILAVAGGGYYDYESVYAECYYTQIGTSPGPTATPTPMPLGVQTEWQIYR